MENNEYYKTAELFLPQHPQWRIWKFRVKEGDGFKFIKIKDVIRNTETLRKWLIRLDPLDAYYSINSFLNPTQVRGNMTINHVVYRETAFDLDSDKPYGTHQLDIVRQSTIKLIRYVREHYNQEPKQIVFTGGKGFQVIYNYFKPNMKEFNFYGLDKQVTEDEFRVVRLPCTINKMGGVAIILTENDLERDMDYIRTKSTYILQDTGERAARLDIKPMTIFPRSQVGHSSRTAPMDYAQAIYVTNEVNGTKRFIPILKYTLNQKISPRKEMNKLAKKYGLNEWFLIKTAEELYCFSLVAFDKRRLEKILNSTSSLSKFEFKKFKKIFMRVSSINQEEDLPVPCGVLYLDVPVDKKFIYSKPHLDLAKYFNFSVNPLITNYIGNEKPKIYLTTKTRGGV